ncbi:MAG: nucleoside-diphosphate sugar epimerase/dehydratase, partial [Gemmatimonadota bacterium]
MSGWRSRTIESTYRHRQVLVIGVNLIVFAAAYWAAFGLRFDFALPDPYWAVFWATLPVLLLLKTIVFSYFDLHQGLWRYVSISDLERILKAAVVSSLCYLAVAFIWATARPTPRSVILADMVLTVVMIGGIRFAVRVFREAYRPQRHTDQRRALIVGAGAAG